jgi:hypothetical protein
VNRPLDEPPAPVTRVATWVDENREVLQLGLAWLHGLIADHQARDDRQAGPFSPSATTQAARRTYDAARQEMREAGEPARIDRLAHIFQLAPFDEDILLLLFARYYDAGVTAALETAPACAHSQGATPRMAVALFAPGGIEAAGLAHARLSPVEALRRYALIGSSDASFSSLAPLAIEERVARYLLGETYLDEAARPFLIQRRTGACPHAIRPMLASLSQAISDSPRPAALLIGPKRSGRRAAARAIAETFGLGLAELKPRLLPQDVEARRAVLPVLAREAALGGFAVLVDLDQPVREGSGDTQRSVEDLLDGLDSFVIAVAEQPPETPLRIPQVRLPGLTAPDREALWRQALGPDTAVDETELDAACEHFRIGPDEIEDIADVIRRQHGSGLWRACRVTASRGLDALADRIEPRFSWDDIVLPAQVVHDLHAIADQVRHRSAVYERGGFGRKLARGRGVTALFAGPSGVGKTMAAEVVAHDLDLDLYRVDLSSVISKYIGETEQNLKRVFDAAEASGALLFFDEADALFGKRSEVKDSHDRYANIEVSYLLQRMESYSGLAILATNLKGHLDPAFLRRLRFVIDIPFPDASQRRAIWAAAFPRETATHGLDYDALGRIEIAGGNIVVIAVNAAFLAAGDGGPVAMAHIARAARAELRKLDKDFRPSWAVPEGFR